MYIWIKFKNVYLYYIINIMFKIYSYVLNI